MAVILKNYLSIIESDVKRNLPPEVKEIRFIEDRNHKELDIELILSDGVSRSLHYTDEALRDHPNGTAIEILDWVNEVVGPPVEVVGPPVLNSLRESAQDATEERLREIVMAKEAAGVDGKNLNYITDPDTWHVLPPDTAQRASQQERERQMQAAFQRLQAQQQTAVPSLFLADPKYAPYGASYQILENQIIDNHLLNTGHKFLIANRKEAENARGNSSTGTGK